MKKETLYQSIFLGEIGNFSARERLYRKLHILLR